MTEELFDENEMAELEKEIQKKKRPPRIAKSTGKPDKRTVTSKLNAKKAGQVKLQKKYNIEEVSDNDSSDSEDESVIVLKKGKGKKKQLPEPSQPISIPINNDYEAMKKELDEMKKLMAEQKKPIETPKVIEPVKQFDPLAGIIRSRCLNF